MHHNTTAEVRARLAAAARDTMREEREAAMRPRAEWLCALYTQGRLTVDDLMTELATVVIEATLGPVEVIEQQR